jgi:hypothetical protein
MARNLLSVSADAKTRKGEARGVLTGVLYMSPSTAAGLGNVCPFASPGCIATCLNTAGRGVFNSVQAGRERRTREFFADRRAFTRQLAREIDALSRKAKRLGMTPAVRLNGTSDIGWEAYAVHENGATLMDAFPEVQFYDYTKSVARMRRYLDGKAPRNYSLTFSRSECNERDALSFLARGGSVAVVFDTPRGAALPEWWNGYAVIDGDTTDARFMDGKACSVCARPFRNLSGGARGCAVHGIRSALVGRGYVVGLRAKGKARRDVSGFVVKA